MARNRPVISCIVRQRPRSEPKFHQAEMFLGAGKSTTAAFSGLKRGKVFRMGLGIDYEKGRSGPEE
jgi:hypothetical protein